jgi:membrane associated rhomboid family serine protease
MLTGIVWRQPNHLSYRPMRSTWRSADYEVGWAMRPTPVVKCLLIANAVVFGLYVLSILIGRISGWTGFGIVWSYLALSPSHIQIGCLWEIVTYMFLHADVWHIIFNLFGLYFFGNEVESTLGSKRFTQLYFLAGIVGGLAWLFFNFQSPGSTIGASGAVYGVIIAFATLYPNRPVSLFPFPIVIPAKYLAVGVVLISVFSSILDSSGGVADLAHLGGAAFGYIFVKAYSGATWFSILDKLKLRRKPRLRNVTLEVYRSPVKKDEFMRQQIDPILDKIAEHGIQSLTREERKLLDEAKDRLS